MTGPIPVFEAVEWREPAPGGGSQAQVFRLADGRFAIVKFPENQQGEMVLANDLLSCELASLLQLPVNHAVLVAVDERLLRLPRANGQLPPQFSAGIRCGMIRFESSEAAGPADIESHCINASELHDLVVFEQLVCRLDGRQLLMHTENGAGVKTFAAFDYGFAFGGQPVWSQQSIAGLPVASLPTVDPFHGQQYADGVALTRVIEKVRSMTIRQISEALMNLHPPRWGITQDDLTVLAPILLQRGQDLVEQYDKRYKPQLEVL